MPDGSVILSNALGSIELDALGEVTFVTPLGAFGASSHLHASPFGPTGAPIPNT
jgi:hypothetical protein